MLRFIDVHYHANPDRYVRRHDAISAGRHYQALGGAVVLRNHLGSTAAQATLAQAMGLPVLGSVSLNAFAGGIDYRVVLRALAEYRPQINVRLVVDFPTVTGRQHHARVQRQNISANWAAHAEQAETIFSASNRVKRSVMDIFRCAVDYPIALSTGHASGAEVDALLALAQRFAVPALLVNQPANPLTGWDFAALFARKDQSGIWFEQTALTHLLAYQSTEDMVACLAEIPQLIYSSDLGQPSQMDVSAWRDYSETLFQQHQISEQQRMTVCKHNPLSFLGAQAQDFAVFYSPC